MLLLGGEGLIIDFNEGAATNDGDFTCLIYPIFTEYVLATLELFITEIGGAFCYES